MAVRYVVLLLALGCSAPGESTGSERLGVGICGADGHVISDAATGDRYMACDARVRSVVISNGETEGFVSGECWTIAVERARADVPLVVQFRDASHATLCPNLEAL